MASSKIRNDELTSGIEDFKILLAAINRTLRLEPIYNKD